MSRNQNGQEQYNRIKPIKLNFKNIASIAVASLTLVGVAALNPARALAESRDSNNSPKIGALMRLNNPYGTYVFQKKPTQKQIKLMIEEAKAKNQKFISFTYKGSGITTMELIGDKKGHVNPSVSSVAIEARLKRDKLNNNVVLNPSQVTNGKQVQSRLAMPKGQKMTDSQMQKIEGAKPGTPNQIGSVIFPLGSSPLPKQSAVSQNSIEAPQVPTVSSIKQALSVSNDKEIIENIDKGILELIASQPNKNEVQEVQINGKLIKLTPVIAERILNLDKQKDAIVAQNGGVNKNLKNGASTAQNLENKEYASSAVTPLKEVTRNGKILTIGVPKEAQAKEITLKDVKVTKATNIIMKFNGETYQAYYLNHVGFTTTARLGFSKDGGKTIVQFNGGNIENVKFKNSKGDSFTLGDLQTKGIELESLLNRINPLDAAKTEASPTEIGQLVLVNGLKESVQKTTIPDALIKLKDPKFAKFRQLLLKFGTLNDPQGAIQASTFDGSKYIDGYTPQDVQRLLLSIKGQNLTGEDLARMDFNTRLAVITLVKMTSYIGEKGEITNGSLYLVSKDRPVGDGGGSASALTSIGTEKTAINAFTTMAGTDFKLLKGGINPESGLPFTFDSILGQNGAIKDEKLKTALSVGYRKAIGDYLSDPAKGFELNIIVNYNGAERTIYFKASDLELKSALINAEYIAKKMGINLEGATDEQKLSMFLRRHLQSSVDQLTPQGLKGVKGSALYSRQERGNLNLQLAGLKLYGTQLTEKAKEIGIPFSEMNDAERIGSIELLVNQRKVPAGLASVLATAGLFKGGFAGINFVSGQNGSVVYNITLKDGKVISNTLDSEMVTIKGEAGKYKAGTPWTAAEMATALGVLAPNLPVVGIGVRATHEYQSQIQVSGITFGGVDELSSLNSFGREQITKKITAENVRLLLGGVDVEGYISQNRNLAPEEAVTKLIQEKANARVKLLTEKARIKQLNGENLTPKELSVLEGSKIVFEISTNNPEDIQTLITRETADRWFSKVSQQDKNIDLGGGVSYAQYENSLKQDGLGGMVSLIGETPEQKAIIKEMFDYRNKMFNEGKNIPKSVVDEYTKRLEKAGFSITTVSGQVAKKMLGGNVVLTTNHTGSENRVNFTQNPFSGFNGYAQIITTKSGARIYILTDAAGSGGSGSGGSGSDGSDDDGLRCPQPHIEVIGQIKNKAEAYQTCVEGAVCKVNADAYKAQIVAKINPDDTYKAAEAYLSTQMRITNRGSEIHETSLASTAKEAVEVQKQVMDGFVKAIMSDQEIPGITLEQRLQFKQAILTNGGVLKLELGSLLTEYQEQKKTGGSIGFGNGRIGAGLQFARNTKTTSGVGLESSLLGFTFVEKIGPDGKPEIDAKTGKPVLIPCIYAKDQVFSIQNLKESTEVLFAFLGAPKVDNPKNAQEQPKEENINPNEEKLTGKEPVTQQSLKGENLEGAQPEQQKSNLGTPAEPPSQTVVNGGTSPTGTPDAATNTQFGGPEVGANQPVGGTMPGNTQSATITNPTGSSQGLQINQPTTTAPVTPPPTVTPPQVPANPVTPPPTVTPPQVPANPVTPPPTVTPPQVPANPVTPPVTTVTPPQLNVPSNLPEQIGESVGGNLGGVELNNASSALNATQEAAKAATTVVAPIPVTSSPVLPVNPSSTTSGIQIPNK
jgi:hypothetical protein